MKILIINGGSSSFKYQLIEMDTESVLAKGLAERIGLEQGKITHEYWKNGEKYKVSKEMHFDNHEVAFKEMAAYLTDNEVGVIKSINEVKYIGHRGVHGGKYTTPKRVTPEVMEELRKGIPLAPLHNPANIIGIEAAMKTFPKETENFVVFDTAFHQTMPERAYRYAIPNHYYTEDRIRVYGFHGISHKYVDARTRRHFNNPHMKNITLHLGNGASMAAVNEEGHCIDTSMGFGPGDGLIMGTRAGNIDSTVVFFLGEKGLSTQEISKILNSESGMKGLIGSPDARDLETLVNQNDPKGNLCLDMYAYRVKKFIGAYMIALGGVDSLIFTAGIGENSAMIRKAVCEGLETFGIKIDPDKNKQLNHPSDIVEIQASDSKVKIVIVATNEELQIARDVLSLV
ncbi:acetate kinase [Capnocytophaga sp. G2]|uniref:acetate/propionate family kinase n=1 Tax=Capnocytophaga sp. G2 TaxID=3110695 RepID=UPI002B48A575|nr:acetate kinase [Capnocytophaga sp. G2]MEB3004534.1 acetate kinase [Capnocytophaga sp. G2]